MSGQSAAARRALPITATAALATVLSLLTVPWGRADSPEQLLQAVTVSVGTDGSISGVQVADVQKNADHYASSTTSVDPAKVAADLPVTVSTSYLYGDKTGTNLGDLAGKSGLIEIDVTVTNATVKPQLVQGTYALVATPMSVTGSVDLPRGSVGRIQLSPAGVASPHTTNGSVTPRADGSSTVSWSALLAPPQAPASATFVLVEDADHFALPDFRVSAQPGLVAMTESGLIAHAFGGASSSITDDVATLSLLQQSHASLQQVITNLTHVEQSLNDDAGNVGARATSTLATDAAQLKDSLNGLVSNLRLLNASSTSGLRTTNAKSTQALQQLLAQVGSSLGLPPSGSPAPAVPTPTRVADCTQIGTGVPDAPTIVGQIEQITGQIVQLGQDSGACYADLKTSIDAAIGDPAATCAPASTSLLCALGAASDSVSSVSTGLTGLVSQTASALTGIDTAGLSTYVDGLITAVGQLTSAADAVSNAATTSSVSELATALGTMHDEVATIRASLASGGSGLTDAIAAIATTAQAQEAAVGDPASAAGADTVRGQLAALATAVCALPDDLTDPPGLSSADADYVDGLERAIAGSDCTGVTASDHLPVVSSADSLEGKVLADAQAWAGVVAATTPVSHGQIAAVASLDDALKTIEGQLTTAGDALTDTNDTLVGPPGGQLHSVGKGLAGLEAATAVVLTKVQALHPSTFTAPTCPTAATPSASDPIAALQAAVYNVDCRRQSAQTALGTAIDAVQTDNGTAAGSVQSASTTATGTETSIGSTIGADIDTLQTRLDNAASTELSAAVSALTGDAVHLNNQEHQIEGQLDSITNGSVLSLGTQFSTNEQTVGTENTTAANELKTVLDTLGSANGGQQTGVLGSIGTDASQVGGYRNSVADTDNEGTGFSAVRSTDLTASYQAQQQLQAGIATASPYPPFAQGALPTGSTDTVVFVFQIAAVG